MTALNNDTGSPSAPLKPFWSRERKTGAGLLLAAIAAWVLGFLLNEWKPVWLAPPYREYTWIVYLFILLIWLPLFFVALLFLFRRNKLWPLINLLLLVPVFLAQCLCAMTLASPKAANEFFGSPSMGQLQCRLAGDDYSCEQCIYSSDNADEILVTYEYEVWRGTPFMRQVASTTEKHTRTTGYPCQ